MIRYVKNLETAREIWLALKNIYECYWRKLYFMELCEGGNMNDHIAIIYQTRDKLAAIGEVIND